MLYTILLFLGIFLAFRYITILRLDTLNSWSMSAAYLLKVIVGFYFLYIYTVVYGKGSLSADAGAFMSESKILNDVFFKSPGDFFKLLTGLGNQEPLVARYLQETSHWDSGAQAIISDNRNIMRVHSVIHFFSFGNPAIHVLLMCFFSLLGIKQLFLGLKERSRIKDFYLFYLLLLFPSVLFWTSGILKEPLMVLGLGLFVRGVLSNDARNKKWFHAILGCLLLLAFKPYVLFCIVPALLFYGLYTIIPRYKALTAFAIFLFLGTSVTFFFSEQREKFVHLLSRKQYDFKNVGKGGLHAESDSCFYFFKPDQISELVIEGDSVSIDKEMDALILMHGAIDEPKAVKLTPTGEKWFIYFRNDRSDGFIPTTMIDDSFGQLILNIPEALLNSLLRPHIFDPGSWLKYPAMLEILLLYGFLIYAFFHRKKLSVEEKGLIWSIVIFVVSLSLIIGWVTPVLGAIVRYRIPAFIGILLLALLIIQPKKTINHE